jgi:hypothetical protein
VTSEDSDAMEYRLTPQYKTQLVTCHVLQFSTKLDESSIKCPSWVLQRLNILQGQAVQVCMPLGQQELDVAKLVELSC